MFEFSVQYIIHKCNLNYKVKILFVIINKTLYISLMKKTLLSIVKQTNYIAHLHSKLLLHLIIIYIYYLTQLNKITN